MGTHLVGSVGPVLRPPFRPLILAAVALLALAGCHGSTPARAAGRTTSPSTTPTPTTTAPSTTAPSTTAPTTSAPRTTAPVIAPPTTAQPAFTGTVATVTAATLGASYHPGCPVGPSALRALHLSYWGFDDRAHVGSMVVSAAVTQPVLTVFAALYRARFPVRQMTTVDAFGGDDEASMAADNTSGFNCRFVVGSQPPRWSAHAYGEAIDVNTVENPYVADSTGTVFPPAGRAYLDRSNRRPGMAEPGTALNDAFASVGWFWGGRWAAPDYQHFSKNGG